MWEATFIDPVCTASNGIVTSRTGNVTALIQDGEGHLDVRGRTAHVPPVTLQQDVQESRRTGLHLLIVRLGTTRELNRAITKAIVSPVAKSAWLNTDLMEGTTAHR